MPTCHTATLTPMSFLWPSPFRDSHRSRGDCADGACSRGARFQLRESHEAITDALDQTQC